MGEYLPLMLSIFFLKGKKKTCFRFSGGFSTTNGKNPPQNLHFTNALISFPSFHSYCQVSSPSPYPPFTTPQQPPIHHPTRKMCYHRHLLLVPSKPNASITMELLPPLWSSCYRWKVSLVNVILFSFIMFMLAYVHVLRFFFLHFFLNVLVVRVICGVYSPKLYVVYTL